MMAILFCHSPSFHKTDIVTLGHHGAMPVLQLYLQLHPNLGQEGEEWDRGLLDLRGVVPVLTTLPKITLLSLTKSQHCYNKQCRKTCLSLFFFAFSLPTFLYWHTLKTVKHKKLLQNKVLIQSYRKLSEKKSHVFMITKMFLNLIIEITWDN